MYKSNSENAFQLEHFWRILKNEAKWLNVRDNVKVHTRQPATQSCHTIASSINLDEDNDELNSGETLERPIGKKAEKEKLKKRKGRIAMMWSQYFRPNWMKSRKKRRECIRRKRKACTLH